MRHFFDQYQIIAVQIFGYPFVLHLEEASLILSGIFLGMLIMALLAGNFIRKLYGIEDFGKSKLRVVRLDDGVKSKYIMSVKNLGETVEQILLLSFSPFFTIKRFTERDEKRTKRFLILMAVIAVVIVVFAVLSICTVFEPI